MFVYRRLQKRIAYLQPKTITIDIFDTLLMRRYRAEQWHFWQFSKIATTALQQTNLSCSPLLYFSLRNYYNTMLRKANLELGYDHEASLDTVNQAIIKDIALRKGTKLNAAKTLTLCKKLAQLEIQFEHEQVFVNKKLLSTLKQSKLPIFFITDMYLDSRQIIQLLKSFGLNFKGISSSDFLHGKSSGRSFERLIKKHPQIQFTSNLHIGDHREADIAIPQRMGIQVFWLNLPLHRLRLAITKCFFGILIKLLSWQAIRNNYTKSNRQNYSTNNPTQSIGTIFAPAIIYYLHYLGSIARAKASKVVFVSSESYALSTFYAQLGFRSATILPRLSRKKLIQSYCYILHKKGVSYINMLPMIKKVQRRKTNYNAFATLGVTTQDSLQYHITGNRAFAEYVQQNDKTITNNLQKVYRQTLREYKSATKTTNLNNIILADVGWNSTIQILLGEILSYSHYGGTIRGIYLGQTGSNIFSNAIQVNSQGIIFNSLQGIDKYLYQPEVWESFLNTDNTGHPTREQILEGISNTITCYTDSGLSPLDYYRASHKTLLRTLAEPKRWILKEFAKLQFDYGTGNEMPVPLVDIHHPPWFAYRLLLRDRKRFKKFYHDNGWKWGMASWYHFRLLYRLWRKKTKKPSF